MMKIILANVGMQVIVDCFGCVRGVLRLCSVGNAGACCTFCTSNEKSTTSKEHDCIKAVAVILIAAILFYTECYLKTSQATFMKNVKTRYQNGKLPQVRSVL
ncbi:uncharacterized protein LOC123412204 [Hordeum vulgare subsp. vulgare]|uniref:uncharacterized protein LOC123412204 n=1 Tax=Hordeum vulgare subsp. vulgare TaxID=112509 RepID=UPI001D1A3877|nr:uncharacterized protein LOC123412204 [Hordeum vulgare subsp. vulgare]